MGALLGRPVLACGSTFDILADPPVSAPSLCFSAAAGGGSVCCSLIVDCCAAVVVLFCCFFRLILLLPVYSLSVEQHGVQVEVQSPDPHSTAQQIGLRLLSRYCTVLDNTVHLIVIVTNTITTTTTANTTTTDCIVL